MKRWRGGWTSMLLLGLALAIAEEFLIQQTSLALLPALKAEISYGRALGINWVWLLAMLGFESVWVVLVPVQFTELIFPDRRDDLWLSTRGLWRCVFIFVVGAVIAWYGWTQRARPLMFHVPKYQPPVLTLLCGSASMLLLIWAGAQRATTNRQKNVSSQRRLIRPSPPRLLLH